MKGKKFKLHNIGHLRTWLKTGGGYHGGRAVAQAAKFGEAAIPILIEGLLREGHWNEEGVCRDALAKIGKPAVPALLEVLNGGGWNSKTYAIQALGKMREKSAVPIFAQMLRNTNAMKKSDIVDINVYIVWASKCIVEALGKIKSEEAIDALVEALGSPHSEIQEKVGVTFEKAGTAAIPGLIRGLKSGNSETRRLISWRLNKLGKLAVWELKKVIYNEEEDFLLRFRAIQALDDADDIYALDILLKNITDIDFCGSICQQLQQKEPRNSKDLHSIRKARAEFKRKWGKKDYSGWAYRNGATAMRNLYLNWGGKLSENANRLVKNKRLPRPKIFEQDEIKRIPRVRRVNL